MRMIVLNGSPRGRTGNTQALLDELVKGYGSRPGHEVEILHLRERSKRDEHVAAFGRADLVLLAMPLYVHAMPGIVKEFLEAIPREGPRPQAMAFLVQSGFPEAHQSAWLVRYLERLPGKLGCTLAGISVRGGVEGMKIKPPWMLKDMLAGYRGLGEDLARTGRMDPARVARMAQPYRLSRLNCWLIQLLSYTGLTNFYWDSQLKKHGAYRDRFATPYA